MLRDVIKAGLIVPCIATESNLRDIFESRCQKELHSGKARLINDPAESYT